MAPVEYNPSGDNAYSPGQGGGWRPQSCGWCGEQAFEEGFLGGDQFYVHAKNLFDEDPPFINTTANGAGASSGAAFGFNAFNASPIGRVISMGVRAKL